MEHCITANKGLEMNDIPPFYLIFFMNEAKIIQNLKVNML